MKYQIAVGLTGLIIATSSFAGGTSTTGTSTSGQTMQAFTAVADDPSAVYYNPAALAFLKGTQIYGGASINIPIQTYRSTSANTTRSVAPSVGPNLYYTSHANKLAYGVGVYSPFARKTKYDSNAATGNMAMNAHIVRVDLTPTVAYALTKNIAFGFGLVGSYTDTHQDMFGLDEQANGFGWSVQAATMVKLTDKVNFGAVYRSRQSDKLSGTGSNGQTTGHYKLHMRYPDIVNLGLAWHASSKLLVSIGFDREYWKDVGKLITRRYNNPILDPQITTLASHNSNNYRVGARYTFDPKNQIRFGYGYYERATPFRNIVAAQPDYNFNALAFGYSHTWNQFRFDVGYEANISGDTVSHSASPLTAGKYKLTAHMIQFAIKYDFAKQWIK